MGTTVFDLVVRLDEPRICPACETPLRDDEPGHNGLCNECAALGSYVWVNDPTQCRACGAVISRREQHARWCENAEER